MFVSSESFSSMFKVDTNQVLLSREFQPYVILVDILNTKYRNVLREKTIKLSDVRGQTSAGRLKHDIPPIENIKTVIKEEEFSEQIEDIASSVNGDNNSAVSDLQGQTMLGCEHDNICQIESIKTLIKEEEFSEHIDDISPVANRDILTPIEPQDVTTSENQLYESVFQSIGVNEESESCNSLQNDQMSKEVSTSSEIVDEDIEVWSSLDLHLSPESDDNHDNTVCENEEEFCHQSNQSEMTSQDDNISLDTSSILASTCSSSASTSRKQSLPVHHCSPDIFAESPEGLGAELASTSSSSTCPLESSAPSNAGEDNRELQEEWNSQELSMVSRRLRLRSKQAKRLILEVIRKRQMADETLESFKKRLRRM